MRGDAGRLPEAGRRDDILAEGETQHPEPEDQQRDEGHRREGERRERADGAAAGILALGHSLDLLLADELRARLERALVLALRLDVQFGDAAAARCGPRAEPDGELPADDEGGEGQRRVQLILDELRALARR